MSIKKKSIEEALTEIENIVKTLQTSSLPLDDFIEKYKDGLKLTKSVKKQLENAELQIKQIEENEAPALDQIYEHVQQIGFLIQGHPDKSAILEKICDEIKKL